MPLDFPSSPTNGQTFGQYTYDSTKGVWRVAANNATSVISSPTAPSSPAAGNVWFNTNDGSLYVYFNDGDTSQWVEMRSEVATSQIGLVPIVPTSVTVGSGSASVSTTGAVTFSSATNICLNGVFTSAYRHYQIVLDISNAGASAQEIYGWFTNAGTSITTAWYGAGFVSYYTGTTGAVNLRNNGNGGWVTHASGYASRATLNVFIDSANNRAQYDFSTMAKGIGAWVAGGYGTDGATDGFRVSAASGVASSGTFRVYGLR